MRRSLITIFILSFVTYAFVKNQKQLNLGSKIEESPTYQFIKEAKTYVQALTADPPHASKSTPILSPEEEKHTMKPEPHPLSQKSKKASVVNNAIGNIVYNVIHTPKGQELVEKILSNQNFDYSNKKVNPYNNNSAIEVITGEGEEAECGDTVKAHYILRLVNGQEVENTTKTGKPSEFRIGAQQVIKGLEYAVMGMKKGGHKRLVTPPKTAYKRSKLSKGLIAGNEFITIDVELLEVEPLLKDWRKKIRIYESTESKDKRPILCSNNISFNFTLSTADDKILYKSTDPVSFILGSSNVPPAINKAFHDIRSEEKRTVIFPSSLIYNQPISFLPKSVKIPGNTILILDIQARP